MFQIDGSMSFNPFMRIPPANLSFFLFLHVKTKIFFFTLHKHPGGLSCFFVLFVHAQSRFFLKKRDPLWEAHTGCLHFQASEKNDCFVFLFNVFDPLSPFASSWGGNLFEWNTSLALYLVS